MRLDADARKSGLKASQFFPGLYYLPGEQGGDAYALMWATCFFVFGEEVMKSFLAKFSVGSSDTNTFRYCVKQLFIRDKIKKCYDARWAINSIPIFVNKRIWAQLSIQA